MLRNLGNKHSEMKMYERPKTQVVWVRLTGSLLEDEQMTIGSKTMKVGESDAKQGGGHIL